MNESQKGNSNPNPITLIECKGADPLISSRNPSKRAKIKKLFSSLIFSALIQSASGAVTESTIPRVLPATEEKIIPSKAVDLMLEMAGVRATDFVIDLGSGQASIIIEAAKKLNARGIGLERDPNLFAEATTRAAKLGVDSRIKILKPDLTTVDLASATVIIIVSGYQPKELDPKKLFSLKAGTRIVAFDWEIENWSADARLKIEEKLPTQKGEIPKWINLWVVPAKVEGAWETRIPEGDGWVSTTLRFAQTFQQVTGDAYIHGKTYSLERLDLKGEFLSFRIQKESQTIIFVGQAQSGRILGQVNLAGNRSLRWRALKVNKTP